jgi:hypothetical protein
MVAAKKTSSKKGASVKGEGAKARKAISKARKSGATTKNIAAAANRDDSTIALIENGTIKNTPKGLASKISKAKTTSKTPTKKTQASKKKAVSSRKKHK